MHERVSFRIKDRFLQNRLFYDVVRWSFGHDYLVVIKVVVAERFSSSIDCVLYVDEVIVSIQFMYADVSHY